MFSAYHPVQLVLGLTVWAIWFSVLYGGMSLGCAIAPPPLEQGPLNWLNAVLLLLTLLTSALLVYWAWRCWRASRVAGSQGAAASAQEKQSASRRFISRVAASAHLAAALSTLAIGLPILVLPPCI